MDIGSDDAAQTIRTARDDGRGEGVRGKEGMAAGDVRVDSIGLSQTTKFRGSGLNFHSLSLYFYLSLFLAQSFSLFLSHS